jgi:hypothetical protein
MNFKSIISIVFLTTMSGCLSQQKPIDTQSVKAQTPTSAHVLIPTGSISTQAPAQISTQFPIDQKCNSSNYLKQTEPDSEIVFYEPNEGLYFYNVSSSQEKTISNTADIFPIYAETSPDNKRIVVFDTTGSFGKVISSDGAKLELNTKNIDGIFYGWLDNQKILFVDRSYSDGSSIVLDIKTGNIEKIPTNLNDVNFDSIFWYADGSQPSVIFDFSLNRLIYTRTEVSPTGERQLGFIMRDYRTQKVLWAKQSTDISVQPKWSLNGEYAAVVITDENSDQIHILDREGIEIKTIDTNTFGVNELAWSPDGKKIGFSFFNSTETLAVYDLISHRKNEYQISQDASNIIWAPNSDQIVVKGSLIDLSTNCVFALKPNNSYGPLAWLVGK